MAMAVEEIIAHLEIMIDYGDVRLVDDTKWTVQRTGSSNYATVMKAYLTGA